MVTDVTKKYREILAYGLLIVAGLWFVGAMALLFKDTAIGFASRSALVCGLFESPISVISLVVAVWLVTRWDGHTPNARGVVPTALVIAGLDLLFGVITYLAQFGSPRGFGFLGIPLAGKVVGGLMGLGALCFLAVACLYILGAFQGLPAPAAQPQWTASGPSGSPAGYGGSGWGQAPPPGSSWSQPGPAGWVAPQSPGWGGQPGSGPQPGAGGSPPWPPSGGGSWESPQQQAWEQQAPGSWGQSAQPSWEQPPWEQPPWEPQQPSSGSAGESGSWQWGQESASEPPWVQPTPTYGDTPPAYGDTPPAYGDTTPPPAYRDTPPAYGDTTPPPAYGDTPPAYGDLSGASAAEPDDAPGDAELRDGPVDETDDGTGAPEPDYGAVHDGASSSASFDDATRVVPVTEAEPAEARAEGSPAETGSTDQVRDDGEQRPEAGWWQPRSR